MCMNMYRYIHVYTSELYMYTKNHMYIYMGKYVNTSTQIRVHILQSANCRMLREDHRYIGFRGKINNSFLVHMQKLDNRPQHKTAPKIRRQKQTYIDTNTYSIEQTHMSKIRHKHSYTLHFTSKLAHENTLTYRQALKIKHTPTHTKPHKCVAQHTYAITYTVFAILFNKQSVTKRRLQRGYFACTVEYG